jgi:hypothetical protein
MIGPIPKAWPLKPLKRSAAGAAVVTKFIDAAKNHTDAERVAETFHGHELHIGQNPILKVSVRILGVELQLPDAIDFDS